MNKRRQTLLIHLAIILFAIPTMAPFALVLNNTVRNTSEVLRAPFSPPKIIGKIWDAGLATVTGSKDPIEVEELDGTTLSLAPREALDFNVNQATRGYRRAWDEIRPLILNTLFVCIATAAGVLLLGSITAYLLSRYRFFGHRLIFYFFICTMMFPGVLTLVPSFLLVKKLGLINTYWVLILPFIAGGQVFAIFVFKSFFDGLPEDLFESARIDGAGHMSLYLNIVLPLSKPVMSVILVMNVMGTWNNFLWPFITTQDLDRHMIASGLFILARSETAMDAALTMSAFVVSSIPLLLLFIFATKPFVQGMTSGAFKA